MLSIILLFFYNKMYDFLNVVGYMGIVFRVMNVLEDFDVLR